MLNNTIYSQALLSSLNSAAEKYCMTTFGIDSDELKHTMHMPNVTAKVSELIAEKMSLFTEGLMSYEVDECDRDEDSDSEDDDEDDEDFLLYDADEVNNSLQQRYPNTHLAIVVRTFVLCLLLERCQCNSKEFRELSVLLDGLWDVYIDRFTVL